jgi:hypothetical protein
VLLSIFFWDYPHYSWFSKNFGGMDTWRPGDGCASYSAECVEGDFSEVRSEPVRCHKALSDQE